MIVNSDVNLIIMICPKKNPENHSKIQSTPYK